MAYRPGDFTQLTKPRGDFKHDLSRQLISADSIVRVHGFNNAVGSAATESINFQGGLYEFPEAGAQLVITSSDVLDDGVGLKATSSAIFIVNHIEDPLQFSITSSLDARIVFSGSATPAPPDSASLNLFYFFFFFFFFFCHFHFLFSLLLIFHFYNLIYVRRNWLDIYNQIY